MALSPREDRIALQDSGGQYPQIWIMETRRGTLTRLTSEDRWNAFPRFSPDGTLLAWSCAVETPPNPFVMNIDGTGEPRRLLYSSLQAHPMSWSPDGKWIVYVIAKGAGFDLGMVPAAGGQLRTLIGTNFTEYSGRVSPDGRWLAYESDESGQREIYVTTFPEPRGKWRISTSGGVLPMWNPARPELIYREPQSGRLMSVRIGEGSTPEPETPQPLFSSDHGDFAISRDGQRILVNQQVGAREAPPIMIVKHWQPEASR